MSLKVCHIISGDLWAGAEVMAFSLLSKLMKYSDIDLTVIVLNHGKLASQIKSLGIPCYVFDEKRLSFIKILKQIREINKRHIFHIIHSHRYKENTIVALAITGSHNCKLITTVHGLPEYHDNEVDLYRRIKTGLNYFLLSRRFDRVIAVSLEMKDKLVRNYGFPEAKVAVIHNGIKIHERSNVIERNKFTIGSAGRIFPVKDFPLMVQIAKRLIKKYDNIYFELAGDGPGITDLRKEIQKNDLQDRFSLKGNLENMESFYRGLNLYINTSRHEGIPLTVLEAMENSCPVIAPRVGGLSEIIDDGENGFLLDSRDPACFAAKIEQIFLDHTLGRRIGVAAREKVRNNFSVSRMAEQYYQLYWRVIKED